MLEKKKIKLKKKKPSSGLHSHRCCSATVGKTHPPCFSPRRLVTVSTLVITSGENSHADTPDNPWAINKARISVG